MMFALLMAVLLGASPADETTEGVYLIFDASGSMWGRLEGDTPKITLARQVLKDFLGGDFAGRELALRVYGHRREGDCRDSELGVGFAEPGKAVAAIERFMAGVKPVGKTPITYSLTQALTDFGTRSGCIILISDGIETCDRDPCELVREWRERNVSIAVHVVGLGLDEVSRKALACISEAAGTAFHDADSADTLAKSLADIRTQSANPELLLEGLDEQGAPIPVVGMLVRDGKPLHDVSSGRRNRVPPGSYSLSAGVLTANGSIYRPVTRDIQVAETGATRVQLRVTTPARVKAVFIGKEGEQRGAQVHATRDGQEAFSFRWMDTVYAEPGTYSFRSQPNAENDLTVAAELKESSLTEVRFEMVHTVTVVIKMVASGSGLWFRENYELHQNGQLAYKVHAHNGARVLPGTYDLHLPNLLSPYVHKGLVVSEEPNQQVTITVPVGHVTILYQKPDGSRDADKRCFIERGKKHTKPFGSGQKIPLTPGSYTVNGWRGDYEPVAFDVAEGDDKEIILRAR